MRRTSTWTRPLAFALLIAMVGLLFPAGHAALAVPLQQNAPQNQQVVYLDGTGQVVAAAWQQGNLSLVPVWGSGSGLDSGWTNFVLGDFNGDGRKEVVATRGGQLKAYNPLPSAHPLTFNTTLPSGQSYHLLAAGDFLKRGYDQLAFSYRYTDSNNVLHEDIGLYTPPLPQNEPGDWVFTWVRGQTFSLQAMVAGDVNRDGFADLSVEGETQKDFFIISGQNLNVAMSQLYWSADFCCNWLALAVGDVNKDLKSDGTAKWPGNEIIRTRDTSVLDSVLEGWFNNETDDIDDFWGSSNFPSFYALALGDIDGLAPYDQEVIGLRDPENTTSPYLVMLNPGGPGVRTFEIAGDCCGNAWQKVAAGDINGDGRAEVAIVRQNLLRIFYQPAISDDFRDFNNYPNYYSPANPTVAIGDLGFSSGLVVSPGTLNFNFAASQFLTSASQTLQVTSGTAGLSWTATIVQGAPWLTMSPTQGTTPGNPRVSVSAQAAGVGTKKGTIHFVGTSGGSAVSTMDVTVNVTVADPGLVVYPTTLTFLRDISGQRSVPSQSAVTIQIPNIGANQTVGWTATAIANTTAQQFQQKMAAGKVQSKNGSLLIDGATAAAPNWLQISPANGQLTFAANSATVNFVVNQNASALGDGAKAQAIVVFLTSPYRPDWVRTVEVDLLVSQHVYQQALPVVSN